MKIIDKLSPNFYSRRGYKPEAIVIHIAEGNNPGLLSWICNPRSQVSYHYVIGKKGEIWRIVKEEDAAWHAGVVRNPTWVLLKKGVNPNWYTIGVCFEGFADTEPTELQYTSGRALIQDICKRNNIPINSDRIVPHRMINGAKTCPGKVNLSKLLVAKRTPYPLVSEILETLFKKKDMKRILKNPVFKRFLKGLGASILAFMIKFGLENAGIIVPTEWVPLFTGILLAIEKAIPKNL